MEVKAKVELSIVVPVFNEEEVFVHLVERLVNSAKEIGVSYELIFVNDGSRDNTLSKIKEAHAKYPFIHFISFSRNFGHQVAVSAGMEHASGNAIITIDGDLQDPPELMKDMYQKYLEGNKVVYAQRTKRKNEPVFKKTATYIFYRLLASMVSYEIPLDVGDFRLVSRDVVLYLKEMDEYDKYIRGQIAWPGLIGCRLHFFPSGCTATPNVHALIECETAVRQPSFNRNLTPARERPGADTRLTLFLAGFTFL